MERELEPGRMVCACVIEASCFCSKFALFFFYSVLFLSPASGLHPHRCRRAGPAGSCHMACRQAQRGDGRACVCVCVFGCACAGVSGVGVRRSL